MEKKRYVLVRNDGREAMYQKLSGDLIAVEPPIWMMLREQVLKAEGHTVLILDTQVSSFEEYTIMETVRRLHPDAVEVFPTGNHPSAYIQQRDGIEHFVTHLQDIVKDIRVHYHLDFDPIGVDTDWSSFHMNKYRAHNWHSDWGTMPRSPYGAIFTSIGCPFRCDFCCIKDYYGVKYSERSFEKVMIDIFNLYNRNKIRNIKLMDEIFFLKKSRVEELCDRIIAAGYPDLNMWAYARIDTVSPPLLEKLRKAGFRWLCVGIESGNEDIRRKAQKGTFTNERIIEVVKMIQDAGISVVGNFIFGFPDDNFETMRETQDFALKLKCEFTNLYTMMAYPGSELIQIATKNGWQLPKEWTEYSQYSYICHPIRTHNLESHEVLKFRDEAFEEFYRDESYRSLILEKFGQIAVDHIDDMLKVKIKRRLLEKNGTAIH